MTWSINNWTNGWFLNENGKNRTYRRIKTTNIYRTTKRNMFLCWILILLYLFWSFMQIIISLFQMIECILPISFPTIIAKRIEHAINDSICLKMLYYSIIVYKVKQLINIIHNTNYSLCYFLCFYWIILHTWSHCISKIFQILWF